jgi:3-deoxy-D-manno-octulosonate 8-phosphate phosphatase (KDO 8-P phosphatase)
MPEPQLSSEARGRLSRLTVLACDVDGTLTDGAVTYDDAGRELKSFHIQDGLGIVLAGFVGLRVVWITGRNSPIVERRAKELGVSLLLQGVRDKAAALTQVVLRLRVLPEQIAFIGDDLNDIPALRAAGAALCPADAAAEVQALAHFVTPRGGGRGAVRDAVETILRARGDYDAALGAYLVSLTADAPAVTPAQ